MSAIKNILAIVGDPDTGQRALATALQAAQYLEAHVDALHVRPDPLAGVPIIGESMSAPMIEEMTKMAEHTAVGRASKTRAMFDATVGGAAASWIEDEGFEDQIVAQRACRADLIVMAPDAGDKDTTAADTLSAALMQTGRAVLAAPHSVGPLSFKRVAIFWNGSAEATRAVTAAMPFLKRAEQVTVLRVEEEEWYASTEDLEANFKFHGISAVVAEVIPKGARTGEALLAAALSTNTGLLVMGAYTRSKLRQMILGSVTGYVLEHAKLPVLFCH